MSALQTLLKTFRESAMTEREKGTYFEELIRTYFRYEATYGDLYESVWMYSDWAKEQGLDARDTGIDLVAKTRGTNEFHAIQCKFYAEDYRVQKKDIDSFFTASGQKPFTHRIIVTTTNNWSENADKALIGQQPSVCKIDLHDLELSQIDWAKYQPKTEPVLRPKFGLRPHQVKALKSVKVGFEKSDRGKLIMACGTGKTFTSLKIAEELIGSGKRVLFLVPSLSLLSQTLTEWTQQSVTPIHSFAVCSDDEVGKKRNKSEDIVETFAHELRYPATTDARRLAIEVEKRHDEQHMSVVFSTYHSINVINEAQHLYGLANFDLIICDEAHRTTGATFSDEKESNFVKVHDAEFIRSARRLYMTATPRIYADTAKITAERDSVALCSMDDPALFGEQFHVITFSEAVSLGLLTDYKVVVLTVDEDLVNARLQNLWKDENNDLKVDDAARIIGCWKALAKDGLTQDLEGEEWEPMRRAVAFCQVIEPTTGKKTHKVSSKQISQMFQAVVDAYQEQEENPIDLVCEARHVDGSMNASEKEERLNWLKGKTDENVCRILSNVRCLSEGVDVPSLDAVLFLTPRSSQVDVVQSVGRVMRNAPNKKRGYVILPVVIPSGMNAHDALNDNKVYKVVWEVLQALRSHDDRFDAMINKLDLIGQDTKKIEIVAISNKISRKSKNPNSTPRPPRGGTSIGTKPKKGENPNQGSFEFDVGDLERALHAKMVQKCGNRLYWDEWANDIAKIAQTHISRIHAILNEPNNTKEIEAFTAFADELRDDLNNSITNEEVIEMLAQHLITKPVFDALFADYSFASNNPVSLAMQQVLDILQEHRLDKEADTLEKFYASVKMRADGIENAEGKQKIVVELYDKFFRNAFPKMTERLGIVYTPVEVVDFIIHSVNDLLKQEFGQTLGSDGVHILDPFTGTGTFITRLLQSGLITKEQLAHKYKNEIHANEIVLLAYYIAAINIEAVYHGIMGGEYQPFNGICLTDTFRLEEADLISDYLTDNSDRRKRLQNLDVRVIFGNPPYSTGQKNANDNNQNIAYTNLDARIQGSYAKQSSSTNINGLYDSYIRAFRWASDRIGDAGIIGFVSGSAWVERAFADGMRKTIKDEFTSVYVFHLRGDVRKNMLSKGAAKEGGNVFESGCMTGIAITFLVKNPKSKSQGNIYFRNIGDNLTGEQKRKLIAEFSSIGNFSLEDWENITPDKHNDWINQRDDSFEQFIKIGDKKDKSTETIFENYSRGLETARDAWCYNFAKTTLSKKMSSLVDFYNSEVERHKKENPANLQNFICTDTTKTAWSSSLLPKVEKHIKGTFSSEQITTGVYRPFSKQWCYYDKMFNHRVGQMPKIFRIAENVKNLVIAISGVGARAGFSAMIFDSLPCLDSIEKGQCFPLYLYEKCDNSDLELFDENKNDEFVRRDGISDAGFVHFQAKYPNETITKEDLFFYIYGLLHSPEYRQKYADNLSKELPRIPAVKKAVDFWKFSKAGRNLAELHLNYETVAKYPAKLDYGSKEKSMNDADYRVEKMKFTKISDPETGKKVNDKTTVVYNPQITIRNIPIEAYDYIVNGKSALDWVMERQTISTDKDSGIVNDANLWATETMKNAKYPLELLLRVITVSLETMKIVKSLPALEIE